MYINLKKFTPLCFSLLVCCINGDDLCTVDTLILMKTFISQNKPIQ